MCAQAQHELLCTDTLKFCTLFSKPDITNLEGNKGPSTPEIGFEKGVQDFSQSLTLHQCLPSIHCSFAALTFQIDSNAAT